MEELEPLIYNFMIQKKMVNCLEQSIELAVGKTKLANNVDIIKAFFKATNIENQSIITNEFVCSAHNLNCNEKVIMWVPMSFFYAAQDSVQHITWTSCVLQFVGNLLAKQRQSNRQRC